MRWVIGDRHGSCVGRWKTHRSKARIGGCDETRPLPQTHLTAARLIISEACSITVGELDADRINRLRRRLITHTNSPDYPVAPTYWVRSAKLPARQPRPSASSPYPTGRARAASYRPGLHCQIGTPQLPIARSRWGAGMCAFVSCTVAPGIGGKLRSNQIRLRPPHAAPMRAIVFPGPKLTIS